MAKGKGTFTCRTLLTLYEEDNVMLRVCSWNGRAPVLEKRRTFKQDGEMRYGRATGLTTEDLHHVRDRFAELEALMTRKEGSDG